MSAMASSNVARRAGGGTRRLTRACALAGAVLAATALPLAAGPAVSLAAGSAPSAPARPQGQPRLTLSVTSVSPSYAKPGSPITLKGRVWNSGRSALSGLSIQLYSSTNPFTSQTALDGFTAGVIPVSEPEPRLAVPHAISRLKARRGVGWTIKLPVSALRLTCFGVYPLTVTVSDPTGTLTASDPVPMPFWPQRPTSCPSATRPAPFPVSWIWPLIDSPHQGPCPGLLDNSLVASLAPGGRLDSLLSVGAEFTSKARLTWAIDPALLDNAQTMSQPYSVGLSAACAGESKHPADENARKWLTNVVKATAGQPVFVTPYADVDVAGLAQYGDNADLRKAFADGQRLAGPILDRDRVPAAVPAGPKKLSAIAWPSGGLPSGPELENLGAMKIRTVILAMPRSQLSYTPGAVTSVSDGIGNKLKVLLGDNSLTGLLASSHANSQQPGTIFNVSQRFLADTAMIVAEAPAMRRPIVVTPPKRWDPASALARDLLRDTISAPWLKAMTVNQMAAQPEQPYPSSLVRPNAHGELSGKLLRQVSKLDSSVALLQSIMIRKDSRLSRAVYGIESSRWAGADVAQAETMLTRTEQFVRKQFGGLSVGGKQVINVTLGGRVGTVPVSIRNSLGYSVQVGLQVTSSNNTVAVNQPPHKFYVVGPFISSGLKLSVNATQTGKAKVVLRLESPTGVLLPDPPDKPLVMRIKATNLGTVALIIFAAALAVFVVASAAQAIRRGRPGPAQEAQEDPAPADGPSGETKVPDVERSEDRQDSRAGPDRTDSVVGDRSELSSVGRTPTEESR
jgi:hypothetical protein